MYVIVYVSSLIFAFEPNESINSSLVSPKETPFNVIGEPFFSKKSECVSNEIVLIGVSPDTSSTEYLLILNILSYIPKCTP